MKTELTAKYIQFLNKKNKDSNKGFTLIELLVVIIIIGILAAIALPSFLNQTAKAKQSEAKSAISSINSAQTSYRQEKSTFAVANATAMDDLGLGLPTSTANYTYVFAGTPDLGTVRATRTDSALKGYAGAVERYNNANSESVIASIVCEAKAAGKDTAAPTTGKPQASGCGTDVELGQ